MHRREVGETFMQLLEALGENVMQLLEAKSCIIGGLAKVAATFSGLKVAKCNFESCILQLSKFIL